ncbi:hypothetical protein, partial [Chryseobacterium sp.]|uniref:hypothetical protein n=1 Tax=Chryseobacterium sp. TaxID=1871047 RepID=UPI002FC745C9
MGINAKGKFQTDDRKISRQHWDNYNAAFVTHVDISEEQKTSFQKNIGKWSEFIAWAKWYPDLFLDLITPEKGGIRLGFDQRVFLRSMLRFTSMYGVFNRSWSKTFLEVLGYFLIAMFFPGSELSITAQTKQNAAELLKAKFNDVVKFYPLLKNEVIDYRFSINDAIIPFVNDSYIDILANAQTSKGQRRNRINIEESALLDSVLFEDVLEPIPEIGRTTKGSLSLINPEELNQQINFFTTSGFRNSSEFYRNLEMLQNMKNLNGEIVLGSCWMLGCWYGRGSTKEQMLKKKAKSSVTAFAQNYMSQWVGASDGQLVDINKLLNCRNLSKPMFSNTNEDDEFVLGIDVARSQKSSNNRSSVSVIKIVRNANNTVKELQLVNLIVVSNASTFTAQAIEVKRIQKCYNAKMAVIDANGLGAGLVDEVYKEQIDPLTGETLQAWSSINTVQECEYDNPLNILYALTPQSAQSRIITHFMDVVESKKLRLLEKRNDNEFGMSVDGVAEYAPYAQTDEVISEVSNLKVKPLNNGNLSIEKVVLKVDKDRFSSLVYAIWWIMEFDNKIDDNKKVS